MRHGIYLIIIAVGVILVSLLLLMRRLNIPKTGFKVREADRDPSKHKNKQDLLGQAKHTHKGPLLLSGFRFDGAPHEILGVSVQASAEEIQEAYHDLIKRFHPDKIGKPGSREWSDAQAVAAKINEAKKTLLAQATARKK